MTDPWAKFETTLSPTVVARLEAAEAAEAMRVSPPDAAPSPPITAAPSAPALRDDDEYPLPIGARLRGDWYPFYIDRFLGSRLVSTMDRDAAFVAIVLWTASMRQDPAGTLPDNDAELAHLAGFGRDLSGWLDVRARGALRKWRPYLCLSSGSGEAEQIRLGHPVVATVALDAVTRIHEQSERGRRAAERALASRMRKLMKAAGAHAGLTERPDFVDAVIADLKQHARRWNRSTVLEAMQRLDAGGGGLVVGMRRRE